jgi:hypothetical protein
MKEHIYIDSKTPAISLIPETLTDASTVWNIHLREHQIHCLDENRARQAMTLIAAAIKMASCGEVLHL